jgi:Tfp pilus assembly pilus retraction ATPase PilT
MNAYAWGPRTCISPSSPGPTGSGKSTTLAAMIDHINETRPLHIVTIEDPIEFMHRNKQALRQPARGRRGHALVRRCAEARSAPGPDVILVGEMRDLETISAAITAAETGHLVFATLHTTGGPATVDRIIDVFPPHQQQQVRMQLSGTLEGVLSQVLLRSTDGRSRVMAMEIMRHRRRRHPAAGAGLGIIVFSPDAARWWRGRPACRSSGRGRCARDRARGRRGTRARRRA